MPAVVRRVALDPDFVVVHDLGNGKPRVVVRVALLHQVLGLFVRFFRVVGIKPLDDLVRREDPVTVCVKLFAKPFFFGFNAVLVGVVFFFAFRELVHAERAVLVFVERFQFIVHQHLLRHLVASRMLHQEELIDGQLLVRVGVGDREQSPVLLVQQSVFLFSVRFGIGQARVVFRVLDAERVLQRIRNRTSIERFVEKRNVAAEKMLMQIRHDLHQGWGTLNPLEQITIYIRGGEP